MQRLKINKALSVFLSLLLLFQQTGLAQVASSIDLSVKLGALRQSFSPEARYRPLHLRYLSYDSLNNNFELLVDKGSDKNFKSAELESASKDLLKYFFIGLALPNDTFWVNLRPDSPDQIIDPLLEQTDIGRILLEADVELKKDTALATSPDTKEGKEYWDKLYDKAEELYGTSEVTIPTLTRPWIVPDEVIISENQTSAYIYKATLKVMLEEDYLKSEIRNPKSETNPNFQNSKLYKFEDERAKELNAYSTQLIKELILPKIIQKINTDKKYANLRQVYYSLILAQWFKAKHQGQQKGLSPKGTVPGLIDSKDLSNLTTDIVYSKDTYFKQYQKSFQNGEYKFDIPTSTPSGQVIRSYFSGGAQFNNTLTGPGVVDIPRAAGALDSAAQSGHVALLGFSVNPGGTPRIFTGDRLPDIVLKRSAADDQAESPKPIGGPAAGEMNARQKQAMKKKVGAGNVYSDEEIRRILKYEPQELVDAFIIHCRQENIIFRKPKTEEQEERRAKEREVRESFMIFKQWKTKMGVGLASSKIQTQPGGEEEFAAPQEGRIRDQATFIRRLEAAISWCDKNGKERNSENVGKQMGYKNRRVFLLRARDLKVNVFAYGVKERWDKDSFPGGVEAAVSWCMENGLKPDYGNVSRWMGYKDSSSLPTMAKRFKANLFDLGVIDYWDKDTFPAGYKAAVSRCRIDKFPLTPDNVGRKMWYKDGAIFLTMAGRFGADISEVEKGSRARFAEDAQAKPQADGWAAKRNNQRGIFYMGWVDSIINLFSGNKASKKAPNLAEATVPSVEQDEADAGADAAKTRDLLDPREVEDLKKEMIRDYEAKFGDRGGRRAYPGPVLGVLLTKSKSREELMAWYKEVVFLIRSHQSKFGLCDFEVELPNLLEKTKSIEELLVCKELILAYQSKFGQPSYYVGNCLPDLVGKVKSIEELAVCKELILAYQSKIGDPGGYVRYCLPALLAKAKSMQDLSAWNDKAMFLIQAYNSESSDPDAYSGACLPALLAKAKSIEELVAWNDGLMSLIQAYPGKTLMGNPYFGSALPSLLAKVKNIEEWTICREIILAYQSEFVNPGSYVKDCLLDLLNNVKSTEELAACKELILAYQFEFGRPDSYVKDCLPALLAKAKSVEELRSCKELILACKSKLAGSYPYVKAYLPALLAKAKSMEELLAWNDEVMFLIRAYPPGIHEPNRYVQFELPALLARVKSIEELRICKELILAYQSRFGRPDSYAHPYLSVLLSKAKSIKELKSWNDEVMLLVQAYTSQFGPSDIYVGYCLSYLLSKAKSIEELKNWNDEVMPLIRARLSNEPVDPSGYIYDCLSRLLAKVKSIEELAVCKELILDYQSKFGEPDSYVKDYLPHLLTRVKSIEELIICKELILAYGPEFDGFYSYVDFCLPFLLSQAKSTEELLACKKLISGYQSKSGSPVDYIHYCLPVLLAKAKSMEELEAWNNELMFLIQSYPSRIGCRDYYIEYCLPVLLARAKSREELRDLGGEVMLLLQAYHSKFNDLNFYIKDCLPVLLAEIDGPHRDLWLGLIQSAARAENEDLTFLPVDMDALMGELTRAASAEEPGNAIRGNKLWRRHKARFYRIEQSKAKDLLNGGFARSGPLLATQKDGVVVPVVGDFYIVSRATQAEGKTYLDIRRLSDEEVETRYGLTKLKRPDGQPYELEFSSLRDVVGRLSMLPGSFGWVQILSAGGKEELLRRPEDLFIPLINGEKLSFQPARLEVKGLGTPVIKSLHNVFDESGKPIQIMENQASQPGPGIIFRLLDDKGNVVSTDIKEFLNLPGSLSGTNYQPYFNSPPGLEEADQSKREGANEARVSANGVTLPNHSLFHWWFKDSLSKSRRSYGITMRLAKSDSRALRLRELLYEFERFGKESRLAKWKAEGGIPAVLRDFLYRVGLNIAGMNQSQLYLFPNGDKVVTTRTDDYGAVVRDIYGRSVGSLMKAEPAYNMVLNNFCLNGDMADLGEYVDGPGTPDFAIAYLLHFMARLVSDLHAKGLLTSEEAEDPGLLAAYLTGASRLSQDDPKYADLNLAFPDPEVFQLGQERFSETDDEGERGPEMANYKIKVADPELSRVLAEVNSGDFISRELFSLTPNKIARIFQQGYVLFKAWDEHVLKVLGYPVASYALTQKAMRVFFDDQWKQYPELSQSRDACEFKELFLGLQEAFIRQSQSVRYSGQTISLEQAIERFNHLVEVLRYSDLRSNSGSITSDAAADDTQAQPGAKNWQAKRKNQRGIAYMGWVGSIINFFRRNNNSNKKSMSVRTLPAGAREKIRKVLGPLGITPPLVVVMRKKDMGGTEGPLRRQNSIYVGDGYIFRHGKDISSVIPDLGREELARWIMEEQRSEDRSKKVSAEEADRLAGELEQMFAAEGEVGIAAPSVLDIQNARPVDIGVIRGFIERHPEFKNAYYDKENPTYPKGCEIFCHIAGKAMEEEGIDVYAVQTRSHMYLLVLGAMEDGSKKEVVIDYTADQFFGNKHSPLIDTRDNLKKQFPDIYGEADSRLLKVSEINFDNSYLIYTSTFDIVDKWLKSAGTTPAAPVEPLGGALSAGRDKSGPFLSPGESLSTRSPEIYRQRFKGMGLTEEEIAYLENYTGRFLNDEKYGEFFAKEMDKLLDSLADPLRISIALRPKPVAPTQTREQWMQSVFHEYSKYHNDFINGIRPEVRNKIFSAKLFCGPREPNIRDFLKTAAEDYRDPNLYDMNFFDGLDLDRDLTKQGLEVEDVSDYSSGRGFDEGSVVNKITLRRNGHSIVIFLKGIGAGRKGKGINPNRKSEFFETFFYQAAKIAGLNSIISRYYPEKADVAMEGFTLMQGINGEDTNILFHMENGRFEIKKEYAFYKDRLIAEFARFAALADVFHKGDRRIAQVEWPQYGANYMIDFNRLQQGVDSVYCIDHYFLFNSDNNSVVNDLARAGHAEMGILLSFPEFYASEEERDRLFELYKNAYLGQWEKIQNSKAAIISLVGKIFGPGSEEYNVLMKAIEERPEENIDEQKAALHTFYYKFLAEAAGSHGVAPTLPTGIDSGVGNGAISDRGTQQAKAASADQEAEAGAAREPGGIDFRSMPIVSRAMANLSAGAAGISMSQLKRVDLDKEWSGIEQMVSSGIAPSGERIREYLQASSVKGELDNDVDKVLTCISDILRQDEEKCCSSDETLKDVLIVLEASRSSSELGEILIGTSAI